MSISLGFRPAGSRVFVTTEIWTNARAGFAGCWASFRFTTMRNVLAEIDLATVDIARYSGSAQPNPA